MGSVQVGVVLAGGESQRMGADKADLVLDGRTFLDRAVRLLESRFEEVIVAGGGTTSGAAVLVPDAQPGLGPLSGIASALAHAGRDIFVLPVDIPTLSAEAIDRLCEPLLLDGQIRVARVQGRVHPLVGAYPHGLLAPMMEQLGTPDRSVIGFLRTVPILSLVDIEDGSVIEVNTPDDLQSLRSG